jgi:ATP-dependent DNA ligase
LAFPERSWAAQFFASSPVRPARKQPFVRPLALSKVHWVRAELVAKITYLSWSDDGLLRHTVFLGLREDKPSREFGEKRRARNDRLAT